MHQRYDHIIEQCLDNAERNQRFFSPSSAQLHNACRLRERAKLLVSPLPCCYARPQYYEALSPRARDIHTMRTLSFIQPTWTFCSHSAALAYGLQVPNSLLGTLHIAVGKHDNRRKLLGSAHCHIVTGDTYSYQLGIPVTSIERTLLDCMCQADFCQGLAIVDSALHWNLITHEALATYIDEHGWRRRGIRRARNVLCYADGRSANGGESIVRGIMIELGFEVPELQVEIDDPLNPGAPRIVDYLWALANGAVIILELDGMGKYQILQDGGTANLQDTQRVLTAERRRESHLNLTGAKVIRISYHEACNRDYFRNLLLTAGVPIVR